jgi:hypothetical protein
VQQQGSLLLLGSRRPQRVQVWKGWVRVQLWLQVQMQQQQQQQAVKMLH